MLLSCARSGPTVRERATSLAREHREGDAVRLLQDELAHHPGDVASRRLLVRVLALTGDLGGATREVRVLAGQLSDRDPLPSIELGHAFELAHQYERALEMYDAATELSPDDPRGPREGGLRAARWGEVSWARPRLEEAVKRGGDDVELWHALGLVRLHAGDARGAEEAYRAGLRKDPAAWDCQLGLATVAVQRGDGASALQAYDAIIRQRPTFAAAHLGRAWALAQLGRKDEAEAELVVAEQLGAGTTYVRAQRRAQGGAPPGSHDERAASPTTEPAAAEPPARTPK